MTETASPGRRYRFNPIIRVLVDIAHVHLEYTTSTVTGSPHLACCFRSELRRNSSLLSLPSAQLVERFFNKIKQCRRVAARYDKFAANCLAFVQLASMWLWLRVNQSTQRFRVPFCQTNPIRARPIHENESAGGGTVRRSSPRSLSSDLRGWNEHNLCRSPLSSPGQPAECSRCRIDLVVVGAFIEGAQFVKEGFVPVGFEQLTKPCSHCAASGLARWLLEPSSSSVITDQPWSLPTKCVAWNLPAPPSSLDSRIVVS